MPKKPKIEKDLTLEALDALLEGGYAPRRRRLKRKKLEEEIPDLSAPLPSTPNPEDEILPSAGSLPL